MIITNIIDTGSGLAESKVSDNSREGLRACLWTEVSEQLFVAAGVTAKDKRTKDFKNAAVSMFKDKVYGKKAHPSNSPMLG